MFQTIHNQVEQGESDLQILTGDLDITLGSYLDRTNYKTDNHVKGCEVINSWLLDEEYVDVFRYFYSDT